MQPNLFPLIYLMGPSASGKTALAIELVQQFPCEIISVDSAMVYRGMDIGTAKPNKNMLQIAPHHLIDIADPSHAYSAGEFRRDALQHIEQIIARGRIPLLVGGSMLYFHILQRGLAELPQADMQIRSRLKARAEQEGWPALHAELVAVDPHAAKRIQRHDGQRIQRALEVFLLTGKTMTAWQTEGTQSLSQYRVHAWALMPSDRLALHQRIALRFQQMLALGFLDEVHQLYSRGDLSPTLPSLRSVGYRQAWEYLSGQMTHAEMSEKTVAATRQLAKRQLTWLRSWPELISLDVSAPNLFDKAKNRLREIL